MIQAKDKLCKAQTEFQQQQQLIGAEDKDFPLTPEDQATEKAKIDSYKIQAITTMLDDFENILAKNFCQFADYEDFSFAQSRNTESLNNHFNAFYTSHF
jgi:hypothetical protein